MLVKNLIKCRTRITPSFLIVGTQKGGTSSLYDYLSQHPQMILGTTKEIHYFDMYYQKGWDWYRSHFPSSLRRFGKPATRRRLTGEASPYYMFHPLAPQRISEKLPKIKLIVLLRNPVDRAYSHYNMSVRRGYEDLAFEDAIAAEPQRLLGEVERVAQEPGYNSFEHRCRSYLSRGYYVDQVRQLYRLFPKEQIQVLCSEDFFRNPNVEYEKVLKFLGLDRHSLVRPKIMNQGAYKGMSKDTRTDLLKYYEPFNDELYTLLGCAFDWDR